MALDFYYDSPQGRITGALQDKTHTQLADALANLQQKTGVILAPYADSRLYPDHARLLAPFIEETASPEVLQFQSVLHHAAQCGATLYFIGD